MLLVLETTTMVWQYWWQYLTLWQYWKYSRAQNPVCWILFILILQFFVPILPKSSFVIIKTSPSSEVGEYWIMIGHLNKKYSYGDSLGRSVTHYKYLKKKLKTIQRPIQKMQNFCGFYTFCAAFQIFKTNLNSVYDVHVLNFLSNYI